MKKAKWIEVPMEYRRNYKKEAVEALKISICGLICGAIFVLLIAIYI